MTVTNAVSVKVGPVSWSDPDARAMRTQLSEELSARYVDRESEAGHLPRGFFVDEATVQFVAVARVEGLPVGHIAVRQLDGELELKNMYVVRSCRGIGVAESLLKAAEVFAKRKGATRLILQTGDRQPEALRFYTKMGYQPIAIYPPYQGMTYSNCFEKRL